MAKGSGYKFVNLVTALPLTPPPFLQAVKQRIHDVDVQVLNDTISNSTRTLFYRTISQFEFSLYLDVIQVIKYRTAMSRLRLS